MSGPRESFNIDFTNYKDRSSAHLAPGEYLVRVVDAEVTETKKNADPMINVFYEVQGGAFAGSPLIDRLVLTDKALWRAVKVFRALGLKVEKRNMNIPLKMILGRTLVVKVSDGEPYNDEIRSEIREYFPAASFKGYEANNTEDEVVVPSEPVTSEAEAIAAEFEAEAEPDTAQWADDGGGNVEVPAEGEVSL